VLRYRADIDGLRALAVLAVVAFHADVPFTGGGFVGVDVFFVISGFLIAGLLLDELSAGKIGLVDFYTRRVLRIFPALLPMLAATLAVGWAIFPPDDYRNLAASAFSAAAFVSNLYFLQDAGYFATAAEANPLLHTWSLSVEEQYYLLFPPFLIAIRRLSPRGRQAATLALWAASFALSAALVPKDPKFAFYMLPTRAWELLTGVLLAMGIVRAPSSRFAARAATLAGLGLIAAAIVLYRATTPFPGFAATLPTLGAALAIWAGLAPNIRPLRALTAPASTYVGRLSYPLYLWHFPAIGFVRYLSLGRPGGAALAAAVAVSAGLAVLSYHGLETPVRRGGRDLSPRLVLGVGFGAMAGLAAFALAIYVGGGFEFRFSGDQLALARGLTDHSAAGRDCMYRSPSDLARENVCRFGEVAATPRTLVWGDSFVEAALPGFEAAAERRARSFLFLGRHGCEPQTGERQDPDVSGKCRAFSAAALQVTLGHPEIRDVVLALRWPASRDEATLAPFIRRLDELVAALTQAGKRVWVTGPLPVAYVNAPRALFLQSLGYARDREVALTRAQFDANFGWTTAILAALVENPDVRVLPLAEAFCGAVACKVALDAHPIYFDDAHLSATGARALAGVFEATLP
jgi:peptidoglycan/LPS O-acetylase OafA/YrhL